MKQRVGIARAYANEPKILIMDEPFGALDAQTRYSMEEEVQKIAQKDKRTVIFVTNNIEEALMLGDRIILFTTYPAKIKKMLWGLIHGKASFLAYRFCPHCNILCVRCQSKSQL